MLNYFAFLFYILNIICCKIQTYQHLGFYKNEQYNY